MRNDGPIMMQSDDHEYTSRIILAKIRYDLILGTPWHHDVHTIVKYSKGAALITEKCVRKVRIEEQEPRMKYFA